MSDGQMSGLEALIRWNDPERGRIAPDLFIPLAEATNLIRPIGRWVLREACRQMNAWTTTYPGLARLDIAVNISGRQLSHGGLLGEVQAALRDFNLPARQLILEVTETSLIHDLPTAADQLRELRELGVRIAIDDFGTGNSSLGQLQALPVDILKIDRALLQAMIGTRSGAAVVQSVVELGRALHLGVVAEGIETAVQAAEFGRVSPEGLAQGFLFTRPLDPLDLEREWGGDQHWTPLPAATTPKGPESGGPHPPGRTASTLTSKAAPRTSRAATLGTLDQIARATRAAGWRGRARHPSPRSTSNRGNLSGPRPEDLYPGRRRPSLSGTAEPDREPLSGRCLRNQDLRWIWPLVYAPAIRVPGRPHHLAIGLGPIEGNCQ
jgi:EAL domain-containing protein (putative c-di-GMP-specific phosphodiesterase class I)